MATKPQTAFSHETIAEARKLIGVPLRRRSHCSEASRDLLIRYSKGLGCRNPLYSDLSYGTLNTAWATLVGHPTCIFLFDDAHVAPKFAGIHAIFAGIEIEWFRQIRAGDQITSSAMLTDVVEKSGSFCGPMVLQTGEVKYFNQEGELVAVAKPQTLRTPRDAARSIGKYAARKRHHYTDEEFRTVMEGYAAETIAGSRPRLFEDVNVGDLLPVVVKGPLTTEDMNFFVGEVRETLFYREFAAHLRRHPEDVYWHPDLNMPDTWDASLLQDAPAQAFGFPCAHDTGLQRVAWLEFLVTNWMGDVAVLKRLSVTLSLPFLHADTAWLKGTVTRLYIEHGRRLVDIDVSCENQLGEIVAHGVAVVELPTRDFSVAQPGLRVPGWVGLKN